MFKYLVVGLGNLGLEYEKIKYNVGFMCIDELLKEYILFLNNSKFNG